MTKEPVYQVNQVAVIGPDKQYKALVLGFIIALLIVALAITFAHPVGCEVNFVR